MPAELNVALLDHAHEDGAVYGSKAVGEPPLMLAFSVREALREAAAAFGPPGTSVDLASPATPEAVWWAIEQARAGGAGHAVGCSRASSPSSRTRTARCCGRGPSSAAATTAGGRGGLRCTGPRPSAGCAASGSPGCW